MASVLVMGAGAVGAYYGACLARGGHDVTFVARGANLEAMRKGGVRVSGAMGEFTIGDARSVSAPEDHHDLALLTVKTYDLESAARALHGRADVVLTLQNGVEAPGRARSVLGDVVLAGSTGIVADLPEPGRVQVVSSYAWVRFGEPEGGGITERVEAVASTLDVEGVQPIPVDDARVALWEKMALMCGMAGLTTLHQRPMGQILSEPALREAFVRILAECEAVAGALGVPLPEGFAADRLAYAERIDPGAMSSMSRDFARGRRIELETFNGAIVRLAAKAGVDVPENAQTYSRITRAEAER